jgi:hypothetical protein
VMRPAEGDGEVIARFAGKRPRLRKSDMVGLRGWPAPGSEDTELGVSMEPEVGHAKRELYT